MSTVKINKIKIYLAAAFSRRKEIKEEADLLMMDYPNFEVTSRWVNEYAHSPFLTDRTATDAEMRDNAYRDLEDLDASDVYIRFTDDLDSETVPHHLISGARMFEMGYAYSKKKLILVVGGHQNVFDFLPSVYHFKTLNDAAMWLSNGYYD